MICAHGVGGRDDLPLPLDLVLQGAAVALLVSFLALGVLWRTPRFGRIVVGRPIPLLLQVFLDNRWSRQTVRIVVLILAIRFVLVPYAVYAVFWVGLAFASVAFGPVWRVLNPLRLIFAVRENKASRPYPQRLGYWPAAAGLFAFVWLELAAPHNDSPLALGTFFGLYALAQLAGAFRYGQVWFERADAFEVYSALLGRLSFLARRHEDGRLVLRNPFDGLGTIPPLPGVLAVVCVCLGSTAFDSVGDSTLYIQALQRFGLQPVLAASVGLICVIALMAAAFSLATRTFADSRSLVSSLVPIVAGYLVAHYYSLLADGISHSLTGPGTVAILQVCAVILGHIVGVIAAHDRALTLLPPQRQLAGQAPLLFLMVAYTSGGLTLLFAT